MASFAGVKGVSSFVGTVFEISRAFFFFACLGGRGLAVVVFWAKGLYLGIGISWWVSFGCLTDNFELPPVDSSLLVILPHSGRAALLLLLRRSCPRNEGRPVACLLFASVGRPGSSLSNKHPPLLLLLLLLLQLDPLRHCCAHVEVFMSTRFIP